MKTRGQRKIAIARMKEWQKEERRFGSTGAKLRKNLLHGTYLWSQTPDTDWYRCQAGYEWTPPRGYIRLVATWPDEENCGGWLHMPSRTAGTMTGWGREAYFALDQAGDRALTSKERQVIDQLLEELDAPLATEVIPAQLDMLAGIADVLTESEIGTVNGPIFKI